MKKYIIIAIILLGAIAAGVWFFFGRAPKASYKTVVVCMAGGCCRTCGVETSPPA
jgi:hypothetical protein